MNKMLNFALVVTVILIVGCSGSGSTEPDDDFSEFIINFQNNAIMESGYVILQTDSTTAYQEVNGDGTITFENLSSDRGTVIIVQEYYNDYGDRNIEITANVDAPLGEWYLDGYNYSPIALGDCNVTLNYPEVNDDFRVVMSPSNRYSSIYISPGSSSYSFDNFLIHRLDNDGNITFFNAVHNREGSETGYCDWVIGENFNLNETNEYEFDLNNEMTTKNISSNRLIRSAFIFADRNNMIDYNCMSYFYNFEGVTSFTAYYSEDFPKDKYRTRVYGDNFRFEQIGDIVPSDLNIPESSLSFTYDSNYNKFRNISVIGSSDQLCGYWHHYDYIILNNISLYVYTSSSVEEVTIPEIPSEILTDFNIDLSLLEPTFLGLFDYDTTNNYDDVIDKALKQQVPFRALYNQAYKYYGDVIQNNRQNQLPEEMMNQRGQRW